MSLRTRDRSITNVQIKHYYRYNPSFGGVYSKDELKTRSPDSRFYVVNLEDFNDGDGSHWVLVYDVHPREIYYFDSYGLFPPPEIVEFMKKSRDSFGRPKRRFWSDAQYQTVESTQCGFYVIYVINLLQKGYEFKDIIKRSFSETNLTQNERLLSLQFPQPHRELFRSLATQRGLLKAVVP